MNQFKSKKFILGFSLIYVGLIVVTLFLIDNITNQEGSSTETHAGVHIYKDGKRMEFSYTVPQSADECEGQDEIYFSEDIVHFKSGEYSWRNILEFLGIPEQEPNISTVFVDGDFENSGDFINRRVQNLETVVIILGDPQLIDEEIVKLESVSKEKIDASKGTFQFCED